MSGREGKTVRTAVINEKDNKWMCDKDRLAKSS